MPYDQTSSPSLLSRRQFVCGLIALAIAFHKPRFVRAQDPLTFGSVAAFVGLALLEGAIAYVGGKLMAKALGEPSIRDVRVWIDNAVADLKEFVSDELRRQLIQQSVQEMVTDLTAINTNLYHYASLSKQNRERNRFLLENSAESTARLVPHSLKFDQAYFVGTAALAYRLITLNALYDLDQEQGHIATARTMVDDAVNRLIATRDRLGRAMSPEAHFDVRCNIIGENPPYCWGTRDGIQVTVAIDGRDAIRAREYIEKEMEPLVEPYQRRADDFLKKANSSIGMTIQCYQKMCERIGSTYTPPRGAAPLLDMDHEVIPNVVKMAGAIVRRSEVR